MESCNKEKGNMYFPAELGTIFSNNIQKLDKIIFNELRVINSLQAKKYEKALEDHQLKLKAAFIQEREMNGREILKLKKIIKEMPQKATSSSKQEKPTLKKVKIAVSASKVKARNSSIDMTNSMSRSSGNMSSGSSLNSRKIKYKSFHQNRPNFEQTNSNVDIKIDFFESSQILNTAVANKSRELSPDRNFLKSTQQVQSRNIYDKQMSDLSLKRIKEERTTTFNAYEDFNQNGSDNSDGDKKQENEMSGFKTQLEMTKTKSLMAYVQETDQDFEQYSSYIQHNNVIFTQKAVSENLKKGLTSILHGACSDFIHELIFQTRDINFQNKNKINSLMEEIEIIKKTKQDQTVIDQYDQSEQMKKLLQEIQKRQIKNVIIGEENITLSTEFFQMTGQTSADESTDQSILKIEKPKKAEMIKHYQMHISSLTEELTRLRQNLKDENTRVRQLEGEKKFCQEALIKVRYGYTKDIINYQNQLDQSKLSTGFEYVNSTFMDITDTFDPSIKVAWEFQYKQIQLQYNKILEKCQIYLKQERELHIKFEKLCEDGNVMIKLKEMDVEQMVGKLMIVEDDPFKIWNALQNNYGQGYFNQVIERVMGVTSDYKESLFNEFKEKIKQTMYQNEKQITELERNAKKEVRKYKDISVEKTAYAEQMLDTYNALLVEKTTEFENQIKLDYQSKLDAVHEAHLNRLQKLTIRQDELERALNGNDLINQMRKMNMQCMFDKWRWRAHIKKLISIQQQRISGQEVSEKLGKLCRELMNPKKGDIAKIHEMQHKLQKTEKKYEEIHLENQDIRIQTNNYINKFNFSQVIISQLNAKLLELGNKTLNLETDLGHMQNDYKLMNDSSTIKDMLIDYLEKEQINFSIKVNKLGKNHPVKNFFAKDPIVVLDEMRNKVHVQFAKRGQRALSHILGEKMRNKFSQTQFQGIHHNLEMSYNKVGEQYKVLPGDKAIQACVDIKENGTVTEDNQNSKTDAEVMTDESKSEYENLYQIIVNLAKEWTVLDEEQINIRSLEARNKIKTRHYKQTMEMAIQCLRATLIKLQKNQQVKDLMNNQNVKGVIAPTSLGIQTLMAQKILRMTKQKKEEIENSPEERNNLNESPNKFTMSKNSLVQDGSSESEGQQENDDDTNEIININSNGGNQSFSFSNQKENDTNQSLKRQQSRMSRKQTIKHNESSNMGRSRQSLLIKSGSMTSKKILNQQQLSNSKLLLTEQLPTQTTEQITLQPEMGLDQLNESPTGNTSEIQMVSYVGHEGGNLGQLHRITCRKSTLLGDKPINKRRSNDTLNDDSESSNCSCFDDQDGTSTNSYEIEKEQCPKCEQRDWELQLEANQIEVTQKHFKKMMMQISKPVKKQKYMSSIVKSTHLEVFDKLLSKKYDQFKMKEQQTQTDFDGVFIGKINGEIEIGKLRSYDQHTSIDKRGKSYQNQSTIPRKTLINQKHKMKFVRKTGLGASFTQEKIQNNFLTNQDRGRVTDEDKQVIISYHKNNQSAATYDSSRIEIKPFEELISESNNLRTFISKDIQNDDELLKDIIKQNTSLQERKQQVINKNIRIQRSQNIKKLIELNDQTGGLTLSSKFVQNKVKGSNRANSSNKDLFVIQGSQGTEYDDQEFDNKVLLKNRQISKNRRTKRPMTASGMRSVLALKSNIPNLSNPYIKNNYGTNQNQEKHLRLKNQSMIDTQITQHSTLWPERETNHESHGSSASMLTHIRLNGLSDQFKNQQPVPSNYQAIASRDRAHARRNDRDLLRNHKSNLLQESRNDNKLELGQILEGKRGVDTEQKQSLRKQTQSYYTQIGPAAMIQGSKVSKDNIWKKSKINNLFALKNKMPAGTQRVEGQIIK